MTLPSSVKAFAERQFLTWGILPILLIGLIIFFAVQEPRFISTSNILNVSRQLSFLAIIACGQTVYLITRNYDLSNGANVALASIVTATVMSSPELAHDTSLAIVLGVAAGLAVGITVGLINGVLVAVFRVSSFMVTLGVAAAAGGAQLAVVPPTAARV